jgi:hypothetical protein
MGEVKMHGIRFLALAAAVGVVTGPAFVKAAPYASGITITGSGTTVNYIMNEDSDALEISINGGAYAAAGDGNAKGAHSFTITSGDTFSIRADRTENGFTQADAGTLTKSATGIPYDTHTGYGTLISTLANPLTKFNSPRGVNVSMDPNASNFGTTYVSNSIAGAVGGRTLVGEGLYALRADQSDAFGYGDTAQQNTFFTTGDAAPNSTNIPYKLTVANDGNVYVASFGDEISGVYRVSPDLTTLTSVFAGSTGPTALPPGQNHGSVLATYVTGSSAGGNLVVYTMDEDLTTNQVTGSGSTTDTNKLWKYNINGAALPYSGMPTKVFDGLIPGFSIILDFDHGADGKWYHSENRSAPANSTGVIVTDASGTTLWDSRLETAKIRPGTLPSPDDRGFSTPAGDFNHDGTMNAGDYVVWRKQVGTAGPDADANNDGTVDNLDYAVWRTGNGQPASFLEAGFGDVVNDLYAPVFAIAVSPDQKWMATLHNNNTILLTPLVNGIPDIGNRLAIPTGSTTISARDLAWDAAGNLHIVSSGQGQYLVIAPGGHTQDTTSWNGTTYSFNAVTIPGSGSLVGAVPEPATLLLALAGIFAASSVRRRR